MPPDPKELIRERLNIADVIGDMVALKPAGRGQMKGLCPFHSEKTPSFHVHLDRGFYYCFGCQAKGDIFDFVMQTQGLGFADALRMLGERAGVDVGTPTAASGRRRDLFDVNGLALGYFRGHLEGEALAYLEGRGLSRASIDAFELGFAPDGWDGLLKHALTKGVRDDDLLAVGLVVENERGRRYDRFRNRVMFPIKDAMGRVVGFSGRVLDGGGEPKYLNTPETELFHKGELLYGLDRARPAIRRSGDVIVVEGYMDVIALHQTGFEHAVAALGAALTEQQAEQLARLDARRVLLAFDADDAGQRAVLAGLDQAVGRRLLVSAVRVPHGKDPADAVLGGHVDAFREALEHGLSEVEFRFRRVVERFDRSGIEGQRQILEELAPVLVPRDVFDPVAAEMRRLVIDHLGMDGARLDAWIEANHRRQRPLSETQVRGMRRRRVEVDQVRAVELELVALLLSRPGRLRRRLDAALAQLPEDRQGSALVELAALCDEHGDDPEAVLLAYREREEGAHVFERVLALSGEDPEVRFDADDAVSQALSRLRELHLEARKESTRSRLLARREELGRLLEDPGAGGQQVPELYAELQQIHAVLSEREAERRTRVPARRTRGKRRR
ncbi:MAG TPA: DNA primase [Trueperaceae bacterium]|nr:DNA primase [Trueperaceae bacterium]